MVRAVWNDLGNTNLAQRAVHLAEELLNIDWLEPAQHPPMAKIIPTEDNDNAARVPLSFQFDDEDFYEVVAHIYHWTSKIILAGLCQGLQACGAPLEWPNVSDLRYEERRCAMLISMSVDNAAKLSPYGCVHMLLPMQVAWGVYWRQRNSPHNIDAQGMMQWLKRRVMEFMAHINSVPVTDAGLIFLTERLQGGRITAEDYFTPVMQRIEEITPEYIKMEEDPRLRDGKIRIAGVGQPLVRADSRATIADLIKRAEVQDQ